MSDGLFEIEVADKKEVSAEIEVQPKEDLMVGDIYESEEERFRVIDIREAGIMVINLDTNAIRKIDCAEFFEMVESETIKSQKREVVKFAELTAEEMEKVKNQKKVFEETLEELYPEWDGLFSKRMKKNYYDKKAKELQVSKRHFRRMLLVYLRSGRELYSLVDQRKFNSRHPVKLVVDTDPRKDTDLLYRTAMGRFMETLNVQDAYDYILRKYFRDPVMENGVMRMKLVPEEERTLTYYQVHNYISKHLGGLDLKEFVRQEKERRKGGTEKGGGESKYGLTKLGQLFEADECELPCYIVDEETGVVVGKAIMYVIVEVKSGAICGCYVSYDNNSIKGLRQVLLSMLEPHFNQTSKYGLYYTEDEFPSLMMPDEIRCDHGAEYESHNVTKFFGEMGVRITHVPVACGSAKGLVESINNQVQVFLKTCARDAGVVENCYRGGDIAKGNACLTLEDLREIVYRCVLYINKRARPGFRADEQHMKDGIGTSPAAVFAYEKKRSGDPRNVNDFNRDRYLYNLLAKDKDPRKFSINKKHGIRYSGHELLFYSQEPWFTDMLRDEKNLKDIEVRYDENNIGCVYICYKNVVRKVPLSELISSQQTFTAKSWDEYDAMEKAWKNSPQYKADMEESKNRKLELKDEIEKKVDYAKTLQGKGSKYGKAKKEDRAKARENLRKDSGEITNRMYENVGKKKEEAAETIAIEAKDREEVVVEVDVPAIEQKEPVPAVTAPRAISHKDRPKRKSHEERCQELAKLISRKG